VPGSCRHRDRRSVRDRLATAVVRSPNVLHRWTGADDAAKLAGRTRIMPLVWVWLWLARPWPVVLDDLRRGT